MTWVAVAVGGGALLGAGASIYAGNKQAGAQEQAANTQQGMFNTINAQEQPFIQPGVDATKRLSDLLGTSGNTRANGYGSLTSSFTPADYLANQDPGYQFQLQTGGQALRNEDTPGVGSLSGPALKDLIGFNQNMAATGYENAFNRFQTQQGNVFNRLSSLANLGQSAASQTAQSGTALGTGIAQAQAAAGGSQAAGIVGAGNAIGNGSGSLAYLLNSGGSGGGFTAQDLSTYATRSPTGTTSTPDGYTLNL